MPPQAGSSGPESTGGAAEAGCAGQELVVVPGRSLLTVGQLRAYMPHAEFLTDTFPSRKVPRLGPGAHAPAAPA